MWNFHNDKGYSSFKGTIVYNVDSYSESSLCHHGTPSLFIFHAIIEIYKVPGYRSSKIQKQHNTV